MDLVEELNLPPVKIHCSVLAEDAIKSAINDYRVKNGLEAIAEPHPNVLNLASTIILFSTSICKRITSPHSGAPTNPVPTFALDLSNVPTFFGFE